MIKWNPVPLDYQNGFITGHSIFYRAVAEAEEDLVGTPTFRIEVGPTTYERLLTGLTSFTEYDVIVLAHTIKGDGVKALSIKACKYIDAVRTSKPTRKIETYGCDVGLARYLF